MSEGAELVVCTGLEAEVRARLDSQTKPPGSLGWMEDVVVQMALVRGKAEVDLDPVGVFLFAGDHGVCARGVSAYPQTVTRQMVLNFAGGGAAAAVLAREFGLGLTVVDCGVLGGPFTDLPVREGFDFIDARIGEGTRDFVVGAAMSEQEFDRAWSAGRRIAEEAIARGARTLIAGEMGIGNTTAASALCCGLGFGSAAEMVGRGTGVRDEGLVKKVEVVDLALRRHASGPLGDEDRMRYWLQRVAGFEMVSMAGFYAAGLEARCVVVVDGFIATAVAASVHVGYPKFRRGFIHAHRSSEKGHGLLMERLGVRPVLDLGMRLGEGTGALMAIPVLRAAVSLYRKMATFEQAGVDREQVDVGVAT